MGFWVLSSPENQNFLLDQIIQNILLSTYLAKKTNSTKINSFFDELFEQGNMLTLFCFLSSCCFSGIYYRENIILALTSKSKLPYADFLIHFVYENSQIFLGLTGSRFLIVLKWNLFNSSVNWEKQSKSCWTRHSQIHLKPLKSTSWKQAYGFQRF